jgi:hypothetical protein
MKVSCIYQNQQRGLFVPVLSAYSFKSFMKKSAVIGDGGIPITTPSVCSQDSPLKQKNKV